MPYYEYRKPWSEKHDVNKTKKLIERRLPDMYIYWLSDQWSKNNTLKARVTSSDMYQEDVLFYYGDDDKTVYIHGEFMPVSEDFKEFRKRMNG